MNPNDNMQLEGTKLKDFAPVSTVAELQVTEVKEGDGDVVPEGATITAHYTGGAVQGWDDFSEFA